MLGCPLLPPTGAGWGLGLGDLAIVEDGSKGLSCLCYVRMLVCTFGKLVCTRSATL